MSKLFRSDLRVGNTTFVTRDPDVLHLRDHVYCPSGTPGCVPAVYDFGRKMVQQSFYSRGPVPAEVFPACSMSISYDSVQEYADDDCYVFLGEIHNHYGHFLLSTLSRLWQIRSLPDTYKIIINAGADVRLRLDHVHKLLSAFGVDVSRLWSPARPVRIKNLLIPCPCFEERNFVHSIFNKSFNEAGARLVEDVVGIGSSGPIYLSKSRLTAGVRKILNEDVVEHRLSDEGYTIVYPETLTIGEQIGLWHQKRPIVAFNGSALHTSIFSPQVNFVSLGWDRYLDTSFLLCDEANGNRADYFYFEPGAIEEMGPSPDHNHGLSGLSSRLTFTDPLGAAESILRAVDVSTSKPKRNLARCKPSTQSSRYVEADYDASSLSATSGTLTGRYQFCTDHEADPWWEVDLETDVEIEEIVVYNRTDSSPERASAIEVLVSLDGHRFVSTARREDAEAFGGLNGQPYRVALAPAVKGRFVRLTIAGPEFFHLDQVEVFGRNGRPMEDAPAPNMPMPPGR